MSPPAVPQRSSSSKQYFVPLEHVPDRFPVPGDLQTRFGYDLQRKGLTFQGWMCKATFDRLRDISSDYHYQRALERLFQIAVPEPDRPGRPGFGLLLTGGVALVALAAVVGLLLHRS